MPKVLIYLGLALVITGLALHFFPNLFSWFGKLPGDIKAEGKSGDFFFPVVSCLLLSLLISLILNLFNKH